ncbi:thiol:disulfide interchange protein DsbB [Nicoletella semolina]|uniref:Disulfide bond formation protein B n=1 Tax=Nicoletella semolina TaxID=271160 RepID=A0A4V2SK20_9PAST|nr:disulfide bond formation protein DsbB [Nicoletella semolina]MDH2925311.1 disulfide bond formation protein B [Nicoletella semolina]TCP17786.1 thiol:disulfide interchange protein DsbB [Nicoletella semolina]
MFRYFKTLSLQRKSWVIFAFSAIALEAAALYFQHGMGLKPCVMCIYERLALFAIVFSGLLGIIAPRTALIRWLALLLGVFGAIKGLLLAIKHTDYQLNPAPWNQCSPFVDFPETLPLNQWLPAIFEAGGDCSQITWSFLSLTMPQWLIIIFAFYTLLLILVIFSQFIPIQKRKRGLFH